MDGGYDYYITKYYGGELMNKVQKVIIEDYHGEQPVGTSLTVEINDSQLLIHSPAMQYPETILDTRVIYNCMRSTLIEAMDCRIKSIVIPAWGGGCGKVSPVQIAVMMVKAYEQLLNPP
jgi:O-acetyl-ADP-ribose deacetylase (regulator of RNase III)